MTPLYADKGGRYLQAGICEAPDHLLLQVTDEAVVSEICVTKRDLPALVTKLYEAAGLPSPVILERPEVAPEKSAYLGGLVAGIAADGKVELGYGSGSDRVTPALARQWAAIVAVIADLAEAGRDEPDPAGVEELTAVIRQLPNGSQVDDLARAILRAGYKREARDGRD